jgi:hypothetical protein
MSQSTWLIEKEKNEKEKEKKLHPINRTNKI